MDASLTRYFKSVSLNKVKDLKLREAETKLDYEKRKCLTKFWKDKFSVLDDLVQLHVKTPSSANGNGGAATNADDNETRQIRLGSMHFDSKLLSGGPMSLKKKKHEKEKVEPVIDIVGSEAICYPNNTSKRGRRVKLASRTTRTLEAAKAHEQTLETLSQQKYTRVQEKPSYFHVGRRGSSMNSANRIRPFTAPRPRARYRSPSRKLMRPRTVTGMNKE